MMEAQSVIDDAKADLGKLALATSPAFIHEGALLRAMTTTSPVFAKLTEALGLIESERHSSELASTYLETIHQSGVVGFAGVGFPVAHKLRLLRALDSGEKLLVCNANAYGFSAVKTKALLQRCPTFLRAALLLLGQLADATSIVLCTNVLERDGIAGFGSPWPVSGATVGAPEGGLWTLPLPPSFIAGEETALFHTVCGRPPIPDHRRAGPILRDTASPRSGIVLNLESVLHAAYALAVGSTAYRREGTVESPGSIVLNVIGDVNRPGLYEVPFGTSLRDLFDRYAGGVPPGETVLAIFPGGIGSRALGPEDIDLPLDPVSLRRSGNTIGRGDILVFSDKRSPAALASWLVTFLRQASCGKCHSCFETLEAIDHILTRMDDSAQNHLPAAPSVRAVVQLKILNNSATREPLYTEKLEGIEKLTSLCAFMRYRGDCGFTTMASNSIESLLHQFPGEFAKVC
jgi:NADH-quinone oxidoreductase subunit F